MHDVRTQPCNKLLQLLLTSDKFFDISQQFDDLQLLLGIVAAATGTAGGVGYIGLKGNTHVRWGKICNVYDKFCRHVGASIIVSLFAAVVLVLLVFVNANSLYRRIPKYQISEFCSQLLLLLYPLIQVISVAQFEVAFHMFLGASKYLMYNMIYFQVVFIIRSCKLQSVFDFLYFSVHL